MLQVTQLLRKFDADGNGSVNLCEFMQYIGRDYSPTALAEARFKKILTRAEQQGTR
jgi:Ca2+-binding EF-hand superfamily protein